jgi:N-acetylmuramoyl-L-alanine amidase
MKKIVYPGFFITCIILFLGGAFSIMLSSHTTTPAKEPPKQKVIRTIIVDAGHGMLDNGGYHGAKGSYSFEDQICLAVAKELLPMLQAEYPEIRIIETRPTERFVANYRRAEIANENKGDLFICIHANSALPKKHSEVTGYKNVTQWVKKKGKKVKVTKKVPTYRYWTTPNPAKGTETYIWGAHKNDDKEVAMRENASMMEEANFKENYGDIDPNSPEFIALSLIKTKQYFKRSATLAGFVQDEFARVGRVDRDVRQRPIGIWVLQATAMPSVLIETGFISNPEDEEYLNSKAGQKELAECITRAVKNYVAWLEKQQSPTEEGSNGRRNTSNDTRDFLEMISQKEEKSKR